MVCKLNNVLCYYILFEIIQSIPHHVSRSSRFSTTTTASGMPVVEPTPHARKRAMVRRGTLHSISSDEESPKNSTVTPPFPQVQIPKKSSGSISPLTQSLKEDGAILMNKLESKKLGLKHSQSLDEGLDDDYNPEMVHGRPKSYTLSPGMYKRVNWNWHDTQHEESDDIDQRGSTSSANSDGEPRRLSSICPPDLSTISEAKETEQIDNSTAFQAEEDISTPTVKEKKNSTSLDKINDFRSGRQYSIYNKYTMPDLNYDLKEYEAIAPSMLQEVLVWDFSIDELEKSSNGVILSRVSH